MVGNSTHEFGAYHRKTYHRNQFLTLLKTGRVENLLFVESKLFLLSYEAIQ